MAQDIELFGSKTIPVPAYIQQAYTETNIVERETVPSLTFTGKVWSLNAGGEKTKLMRVDAEGDESPVPSLAVVILDYAKARGRSYYEGAYDPDNTAAPKCWSLDSVTPEDTVPEPVHDKCATCPMSVKGSRMSDNNKPTVACAQHRIIALVPVKRLDLPPLRVKLAITSDYDGQSKDLHAQGRFAFSNYLDFIRGKGVPHTASIVTKIAFDPGQAYPKILFSASRWLTEPELAQVSEMRGSGGVEAILGTTMYVGNKAPNALPKPENAKAEGVDAAAAARAEEERKAKEAAEAEKARKAEEARLEKERKAQEKKAKAEAEAKAKAEAEAKAKAAAGNGSTGVTAADFDDDEDAGLSPPSGGTTKPATTTAAAGSKTVTEAETVPGDAVPDGITDLLGTWGDD